MTPPKSPGGAWTETVLYSFAGRSGANPKGGVVIGSDGVLYGTTYYGGTSNLGTVFSLRPPISSGGAWTRKVLHDFAGGGSDGAYPAASVVIGSGGVLYGTTVGGGGSSSCSSGSVAGCGTVFALAPPTSSGGAWTETILHGFTGGDGSDPQAGLIISPNGVLYGTTVGGGTSNNGTVFAIMP